jgi:DNA-binding transcriptional ArsR family regulator
MSAVPLSAVLQDAGEASPEIQRMISNAEDASAFLKSLAHGNRLLLLCLLSEKERSVTELEQLLQMRQPAVSQQLARLRLDGLVTTRREGKAIHYSIADERTKGFIRLIYETFCK